MIELALRTASLCLLLAGVKTVHGIARMRLLVPRIGLRRAQQISILTGSLLAFAVCHAAVPSFGLHDPGSLLGLGAVLSGFMAAFDILIGRYAAQRSWRLVLEDFDPRRGNLLSVGLLALLLVPWLVTHLRT